MAHLRITDPRGADLGNIGGNAQGLYIDRLLHTAAQGDLLKVLSHFRGRSSVSQVADVDLLRVEDNSGIILGVVKSLGEICDECTLLSVPNQVSGADFEITVRENELAQLQSLTDDTELTIFGLVLNPVTIHPHIRHLDYSGYIYEVVSIPQGVEYIRGNAIEIRLRK
jgi:hypothetical protein